MIDPETGKFHYDPQWQGPLSGRSFEKQTEDAINLLLSSDPARASDVPPMPPGTASAGVSESWSRGDHVHPAQTDIPGNADTANKLKTSRRIILSGDATGSAPFNGTSNANIQVTIQNATATRKGLMSATDKSKLDNIENGANNYELPAATNSVMGGVRIMTSAEIAEIINDVFYS